MRSARVRGMRKIRGVLFDKDGVLVDFDTTWGPAAARVIRHFGQDDARIAALAAAVDFDMTAERFAPSSAFIAGTAMDTIRAWAPILGADPMLAGKITARMTEEGVTCVNAPPEVGIALRDLRGAGLPLGIATNDQENSARRQMGVLGLADLFDPIMGADSGHGAKPGPGMVLAFAEHLDVAPERIAMVGDSTHDLHAARAAGAVGIAIGTGPAALDDLRPHADHCIETMADLPGMIAGLNGGR